MHSAPKLEGMRPDISLSIYASLKGANHASGSASALFIGGFSIMEMGKVMAYSKKKMVHFFIFFPIARIVCMS